MPINIPAWPVAGEREQALISEVLSSQQWGGFHRIVEEFENTFAAYQHCRFGASAFNGTVTLETALTAVGVEPNAEVIVPAISFVSTATAVSRVGAIPVFVDIEEYSFNIDPYSVERAVTPKTRAIIPVHFGGSLSEIDAVMDIAQRHGLVVIEDAAHAHGSEWNGRRAGSFGLAGSFSFQNGKVLTAGEGGMLVSNSPEFAASARSFINQGRRPGQNFFNHYTLGTNFRITALQAAVLTAQFERLPGHIETRTRNTERLRSALAGLDGLTFQNVPRQVTAHSHYLLCGRIDAKRFGATRNQFNEVMKLHGIPCTPFYPHTLPQNPMYETVAHRTLPCTHAEACVHDAFWFPHRLLLADPETIDEVAATIARVPKLVGEVAR